jgi:hypothetical protein
LVVANDESTPDPKSQADLTLETVSTLTRQATSLDDQLYRAERALQDKDIDNHKLKYGSEDLEDDLEKADETNQKNMRPRSLRFELWSDLLKRLWKQQTEELRSVMPAFTP